MKTTLYKIECLTNLHVGSGEANYNIVDLEVEKDPIYGCPVINASGVKGAIRYALESDAAIPRTVIDGMLGRAAHKESAGFGGRCSFFDARFLSRPMRFDGALASVNVTTVEALQQLQQLTEKFHVAFLPDCAFLQELDFSQNAFWCTEVGKVEGDSTGLLAPETAQALKGLLGAHFAITTAAILRQYPLPVIARNNLRSKGGSLWYEEYVPRESMFYLLTLSAGEDFASVFGERIIQIGGNATVGNGFCEFTKIAEGASLQ